MMDGYKIHILKILNEALSFTIFIHQDSQAFIHDFALFTITNHSLTSINHHSASSTTIMCEAQPTTVPTAPGCCARPQKRHRPLGSWCVPPVDAVAIRGLDR